MNKMPMCPMMMHHMQNMPMMQQMPMMQNMPMMHQMPMMHNMPMNMHNENEYSEDDKDEEYFASMHGENCHRMMPYVMKSVDRMEKKGDMMYAEYPDKDMVESMSEEAYNNMIRDMPDMADEHEEERQFGGRRRLARDLIGILLINELLGRRRRRRRRHDYDYGNDYGYGYGYGYGDNDFYYND